MAGQRTALTAAAKDNVVYALGGHTGAVVVSNQLSSVEAYEIEDDEWESAPAMLDARAQAGSVTLGSKIYVIGGGFYPQVSANSPSGTGTKVEALKPGRR